MSGRSDTQAGSGLGTRATPAEPGRVSSRPPRPAPGSGRTAARRPVTARPVTARPVPGRPGAAGGLRRVAGGAAARTSSRTSFILLVVGLLGGGLLSLLIINTTLAAGSYQISDLQQSAAAQSQQIATLSQQVASDRSDAIIERRALQLGMVQQPLSNYVDLRTGRITSQPSTDPGIPVVRGWVP